MDPNQLRQRRENLGLTATELAGRVGVTVSAVSQWELGRSSPRASHLAQLAGALDCDIADLMIDEPADLSAARHRAGLSQEDLAERIGVPAGSLSNMEAGRTRPVNREQWAAALNITLSVFDRLWRASVDAHHRQLTAPE